MTVAIYDTAGTFTLTVPAGTTIINATLVGGGGAGGNSCNGDWKAGNGGQAGTLKNLTFINVTPGIQLTIVVGFGGVQGGAASTASTVTGTGVSGTAAAGANGGSCVIINDGVTGANSPLTGTGGGIGAPYGNGSGGNATQPGAGGGGASSPVASSGGNGYMGYVKLTYPGSLPDIVNGTFSTGDFTGWSHTSNPVVSKDAKYKGNYGVTFSW